EERLVPAARTRTASTPSARKIPSGAAAASAGHDMVPSGRPSGDETINKEHCCPSPGRTGVTGDVEQQEVERGFGGISSGGQHDRAGTEQNFTRPARHDNSLLRQIIPIPPRTTAENENHTEDPLFRANKPSEHLHIISPRRGGRGHQQTAGVVAGAPAGLLHGAQNYDHTPRPESVSEGRPNLKKSSILSLEHRGFGSFGPATSSSQHLFEQTKDHGFFGDTTAAPSTALPSCVLSSACDHALSECKRRRTSDADAGAGAAAGGTTAATSQAAFGSSTTSAAAGVAPPIHFCLGEHVGDHNTGHVLLHQHMHRGAAGPPRGTTQSCSTSTMSALGHEMHHMHLFRGCSSASHNSLRNESNAMSRDLFGLSSTDPAPGVHLALQPADEIQNSALQLRTPSQQHQHQQRPVATSTTVPIPPAAERGHQSAEDHLQLQDLSEEQERRLLARSRSPLGQPNDNHASQSTREQKSFLNTGAIIHHDLLPQSSSEKVGPPHHHAPDDHHRAGHEARAAAAPEKNYNYPPKGEHAAYADAASEVVDEQSQADVEMLPAAASSPEQIPGVEVQDEPQGREALAASTNKDHGCHLISSLRRADYCALNIASASSGHPPMLAHPGFLISCKKNRGKNVNDRGDKVDDLSCQQGQHNFRAQSFPVEVEQDADVDLEALRAVCAAAALTRSKLTDRGKMNATTEEGPPARPRYSRPEEVQVEWAANKQLWLNSWQFLDQQMDARAARHFPTKDDHSHNIRPLYKLLRFGPQLVLGATALPDNVLAREAKAEMRRGLHRAFPAPGREPLHLQNHVA
ncbi:unnamed protein product, partial [Amoebophrya sp. A120]